jgi:hypothetical protein
MIDSCLMSVFDYLHHFIVLRVFYNPIFGVLGCLLL